MRILLTSDTHGNYPSLFKACEAALPIDYIIHLGDGQHDAVLVAQNEELPLIQIAGNCDYNSGLSKELVWECTGKRLLLSHGDLFGVKGGLGRLIQRGIQHDVDAILYGHTHIPDIRTDSEMLIINPGTLSNSSSHKTYAVLQIDQSGIKTQLYDLT